MRMTMTKSTLPTTPLMKHTYGNNDAAVGVDASGNDKHSGGGRVDGTCDGDDGYDKCDDD